MPKSLKQMKTLRNITGVLVVRRFILRSVRCRMFSVEPGDKLKKVCACVVGRNVRATTDGSL